MKTIHPGSLSATVDALNEVFFYERPLRRWQREQAARWIAARQGLPGAYRGVFFAPTARDLREGARLFTGETVRSRAGMGHVLGEEACRALVRLNVPGSDVQGALRPVRQWLRERRRDEGIYCCGTCSVAYWRTLAVDPIDGADRRLAAGLKALKSRRDGRGRWRAFPFHYTLLALTEIDLRAAAEELRYAAPVCERLLARAPAAERYARRRRDVLERVLRRA